MVACVNFKNEMNKAENEEEKQCADSSDIYIFFFDFCIQLASI